MILSTLQDRAHFLLSQDPTSTTNYVTDAQLTLFATEGVDIMCMLGKVWECQAEITLVDGTSSYVYPTTDNLTSIACTAVDIFNIIYDDTGESLTYMNPKDKGKIFVDGTYPTWWYLFGSRIWLHPTPGSEEASNTCTTLFYGVPSTIMSAAGDSPPFPSKYHHQLIPYMAYRGKQTLNRHSEAATFLNQFATTTGINKEELKRRVGKE